MRKLTTLVLMVLVCGAVMGQWNQSGNALTTNSNEVILNNENSPTSTLWLNNKNSGPTSARGQYFIKAYDWWGATLHFVGTGDQDNERLNVTFDGNVGIGTQTPSVALDINGTARIYSGLSAQVWGLAIKSNAVNTGEFTGIKLQTGYFGEMNKWSGIAAISESPASNRTGLVFYTGESVITEKVRIDYSGRVGIGTDSPSAKLDVNGSFRSNTLEINRASTTEDWNTIWQCGFFDAYQKVNAPESDHWFWGINLGHRSNDNNYRYGGQILIKNHPTMPVMYFRSRGQDGSGIWAKVLHNIGDQRIEGNLTVNGVFNSEEVKVETIAANSITYTANGNTADFVFEDSYHLRDLSEVEAFIKANKHLPEIPSAAEMEEAGVNLAEMNKLLLMKVEELTLYAIEQEKVIDKLSKENIVLDTEMLDMKERIKKLENLMINK